MAATASSAGAEANVQTYGGQSVNAPNMVLYVVLALALLIAVVMFAPKRKA